MPELPEVETTRLGLMPYLIGRRVRQLNIRQPKLRWMVPGSIKRCLAGQKIEAVERRAKYLLMHTQAGSAIWHLGMSGCLRVLNQNTKPEPHDHVDWLLDSGQVLRYTDPRRFGCLLWQPPNQTHKLLQGLGPEPLGKEFSGDYLWERSRNRVAPIKQFIMDQKVVVGVGNIYAAEALFQAQIHPFRSAGSISRNRYARLADAIKSILTFAIERGGTTLRDFLSVDGQPGYFEQELYVYGRSGLACKICGSDVKSVRLGQRSSFYCPRCQR